MAPSLFDESNFLSSRDPQLVIPEDNLTNEAPPPLGFGPAMMLSHVCALTDFFETAAFISSLYLKVCLYFM